MSAQPEFSSSLDATKLKWSGRKWPLKLWMGTGWTSCQKDKFELHRWLHPQISKNLADTQSDTYYCEGLKFSRSVCIWSCRLGRSWRNPIRTRYKRRWPNRLCLLCGRQLNIYSWLVSLTRNELKKKLTLIVEIEIWLLQKIVSK